MTDLHYRTLHEVAAQIAAGEVTSLQVTDAILRRIDELEPRLHAYYSLLSDSARARASQLDAELAAGRCLGPLHGVPIAVKDLCHLKGSVTSAGHTFRRDAVSTEDAAVVARLEAAGAVILGKLATTEGAMTGYHRDFAVPSNPWDPTRWPGVSSAGSGVATAAGLCFGSLGTDTGGSIRWPSAANGLVGLKPTWGRVSRHNVLDLAPTLDHIGPMTRCVRDAARILRVIAGHDPADITTLTAPVPDYEAALTGDASGLRIGWDEHYATDGVEPYVRDAVMAAKNQLSAAGAEIVPVSIPRLTEEEAGIWLTLASAEAAMVHAADFPARASEYGELFGQFLTIGNAVTGPQLAKANLLRRQAIARLVPAFAGVHVLLMPTTAAETFAYDPDEAYTGVNPETGAFSGFPLAWSQRNERFVAVWDLNGYPTLSLPGGLSPSGLPISLQLVGPPLGEEQLLQAGQVLEQSGGNANLHPPL